MMYGNVTSGGPPFCCFCFFQGTLELRLLDITAPAMAPIAQVVIVNAWPQAGCQGELAPLVLGRVSFLGKNYFNFNKPIA